MSNIDWTKLKTAEDILEENREKCKKNALNKRKSVIDAGVTVDGNFIQSDDKSYSNMAGYVSEPIINGLIDVLWKCADGSRHTYTLQELKPVFKAITTFRRACFIREDEILTLIENSESPSLVDIDGGWPSPTLVTS